MLQAFHDETELVPKKTKMWFTKRGLACPPWRQQQSVAPQPPKDSSMRCGQSHYPKHFGIFGVLHSGIFGVWISLNCGFGEFWIWLPAPRALIYHAQSCTLSVSAVIRLMVVLPQAKLSWVIMLIVYNASVSKDPKLAKGKNNDISQIW